MTASDQHGHGHVEVEVVDGVATLRLDRPDAGNALNLATAHALKAAVAAIAANHEVRVVVLASGGRMFCAGGDVLEMAAAADRPAFLAELAGEIHDALIALRALPIPVVAAVHGTAAGAGIGLVLAADIAIASESAKFVAAYSNIGLSPDCGVTALLTDAVGARRAALFLLTNPTLDAAEASQWGLVTETCAPEALAARVAAVARAIAERPGTAVGEAVRLLRFASERSYRDQLDDEAATISRLSATAAAAERIEAFAKPK